MTVWDDLNARARGLTTHLLGRPALEGMTRAPDLPALAAELTRRGYPVQESDRASAAGLELAARRALAARLRILIRWAGPRTDTLAVVFEDEDRRSIAALVRGAVQGAPAELRLSGLIPTPELPERALEELAGQPSPGALASLLSLWRHPLAPALSPEAARAQPDLLQIETALSRAFVQRALAAARREGRSSVLYRYVQQVIDIENAYAALVLSGEKEDRDEVQYWLPGGHAIPLPLFQGAIGTRDPVAAGVRLASGFRGTRLAPVFADARGTPGGLERSVLAALVAGMRDLTRLEPLSVAPFLGYALRLRAEALDVRWLVWGISLGAPSEMLAEGLVTGP